MAAANTHYPWYKKEDTDAFFELLSNSVYGRSGGSPV